MATGNGADGAYGSLLAPEFLARLETLRLLVKRRFRGGTKGERLSRRRGTSIEFADYREYVPGEDLRYLDWNIAARLDKLFLKAFVEEEDLYVALLVDASQSMAHGDPPKLAYARRLAAALAYLALANLDRVSVAAFDRGLRRVGRPVRGKGQIFSLLAEIERIDAAGGTDLATALRAYALGPTRPGLAVVLSDFLDPAGYASGLDAFLYRGFQVVCVHVVGSEETAPGLEGDLLLVDAETGEEVEVSITPSLLGEYAATVRAHGQALRDFALRRGMGYVAASTALGVDETVLGTLRAAGVVGR